MTALSKIMATTAICTLIGGAALAQDAILGADAQIDANVGTAVEVEADEFGVTPGAEADVDAPETHAQTEVQTQAPTQAQNQAQPQTGQGVTAGAGPEIAPGETDPITLANTAIERGQPATVVSSDGQVLGSVDAATPDERGAARLSIAVDRSLDAPAQRVTFVGIAQVDAEGRVVLPLASADFLSRIQAQTDGSAG